MALAFLVLAIANFPLRASESGMLLSMLSLSQAYGPAGGGDTAMPQAVAAVVGTARRFAHCTQLLTIVSWFFVLYVLQIAGVPLRGILGYSVVPGMAMPLAPIHLALALWLIVKGFPDDVVPVANNRLQSAPSPRVSTIHHSR